MIISGNYDISANGLDNEQNVPLALDWSQRHEIVAGATVTGATWRVLNAAGAVTTDITAFAYAISGNVSQLRITATNAVVVGANYFLACDVTFSDTTQLVRGIALTVK